MLSALSILMHHQQALLDPKWKNIILEEMNALQSRGTWDLFNLPPDAEIVGCKYVFTIKYHSDGTTL